MNTHIKPDTSDVLIVGGGIIGLLTARALQQAGAQVTVVERGAFGRESSWAGGGILSPLYPWRYPAAITQLSLWSQTYYPQLAAELLEATGVDVQWRQSGMLILDAQEGDTAAAWLTQHALPGGAVTGADVSRIEAALSSRAEAAIDLPGVAQIRPPRLIAALVADLRRRGVCLLEHTPVERLRISGNRVRGVVTTTGDIAADVVILASGAWTSGLLGERGGLVPIRPVRGQMLLFQARPGQLRRIVLSQGYYAIPREDGHILIGSTTEEAGFDSATTVAARDELVSAGVRILPWLESVPQVGQWSGLRPGTWTGIPYIGAVPDCDGLYINAGHYRNGVVMAPASARLLTDILLRRKTELNPALYGIPELRGPI